MTSINKTGKKNNILLSSRNKGEAPPTETTRMIAAILDGKKQPGKRSKKITNGKIAAANNNVAGKDKSKPNAPKPSPFSFASRPANATVFGARKGLAQLANANKSLKRKRNEKKHDQLKEQTQIAKKEFLQRAGRHCSNVNMDDPLGESLEGCEEAKVKEKDDEKANKKEKSKTKATAKN